MGWRGWRALAAGLGLLLLPSLASADELGTRGCKKKAVDACGCHRVYGRRHCHPKRQSSHCEALAQGDLSISHNST